VEITVISPWAEINTKLDALIAEVKDAGITSSIISED